MANGDFSGKSAYEVLGVSEWSSLADIKASFHKLAKETHPDVSTSLDAGAAAQRFLQILAAYEILSDSERRTQYDIHLFSQKILHKSSRNCSVMYRYNLNVAISKPDEVVDWLKLYKCLVDDIIAQNRVASGSGYFAKIETEFYSAIRFAYYGPVIESINLLPNSFEAEERSRVENSELLHLVSGRDLFGVIYTVDGVLGLSHGPSEKRVTSESSSKYEIFQYYSKEMVGVKSRLASGEHCQEMVGQCRNHVPEMYKNLELHICGKLVATATRNLHYRSSSGSMDGNEDHINVFFNHNGNSINNDAVHQNCNADGSNIHLGTIIGLGSTGEEGICSVYDKNGRRTHLIIKHRTLLVKHMHWYQIGEDEVSVYECRCSRARLPPSKFWLFEPRSYMHDIGGWYVETFGRDKRGRTVLSQRHWDGMNEYPEKRLHPAIYLLTLAYRTLDLEDEKRSKRTIRNFLEQKVHYIFRWCKRFL